MIRGIFRKSRRAMVLMIAMVAVMGATSCIPKSKSHVKVVPLTAEQRLQDFDVAVSNVKNYYGPYQYKEQRLGVKFDAVFAALRPEAAAAKSDLEFFQVLQKIKVALHDGHVSMTFPGIKKYSLPFTVDWVNGKYLVDIVDEGISTLNVKRGDELVSIDNETPDAYATKLAALQDDGYDGWNRRIRAYYLTHRKISPPVANKSLVKFKRTSDGAETAVYLVWQDTDTDYSATKKDLPSPGHTLRSISSKVDAEVASLKKGGVLLVGDEKPFFATDAVTAQFNFLKADVSGAWTAETKPVDTVFSVLYRYKTRTILLLRIPSYEADDPTARVATYEALLRKYSSLADVLVIDQTHNPGGSVSYLESLAQLFLKMPGPGFAFSPRADRRWLDDLRTDLAAKFDNPYEKTVLETVYKDIDAANNRGDFLAPAITFNLFTTLVEKTAWSKPILLLIDELCGSGGDGFPMIMKGNARAKLFGNRTAGMGGNVSEIGMLPNSGVKMNLTRSLFYLYRNDLTLPTTAIIENNGVTPDIDYAINEADFRASFVPYVTAFSEEALKLVP